jgi:hypothetical protein
MEKTPMQELIERFKTGSKIHEAQMKSDISPIEKNRASYLKNHCEAVISIATELLEKEKQMVIETYINAQESIVNFYDASEAEQYYNNKYEH